MHNTYVKWLSNESFAVSCHVVQLAEMFCEEAGKTFNLQNHQETIRNIIFSGEGDVAVVYDNGIAAGFAIVAFGAEHHVERYGYIMKFYIRKDCRGTHAARTLTREVTEWLDAHNCAESFVSSTAGIGEDQQFINLMKKFGFKESAVTLKRNKHEQN